MPRKSIDFRQKPLRIFLAYIARHKRLFFIDTACAVAVAAIDLIFPFVSRSAMTVKKAVNSFCGSSALMLRRDTKGKTRSMTATRRAQIMSMAKSLRCRAM